MGVDESESAVEFPHGPAPAISVVVVNFRSGALLGRCLEALSCQTWQDFEVLLVDNSSEDGCIAALGRLDQRVRLVSPGCNLGFAAANNLAASESRGEWLATLNPDAFPEPQWLESMMDACHRHPGFYLFTSAQLDQVRPDLLDGAGDAYSPLGFAWRGGKGQSSKLLPAEGRTFAPCAAAAFYQRDAFLAAGGFDEDFFCYYEDVDLGFRMIIKGHGCLFVPTAKVRHLGSAVTGEQSEFSTYHITRNRVWTFIKEMPWPLLAIFAVPAALVVLQSMLRRDQLCKARALKDALRSLPGVIEKRRKVQAGACATWFDVAEALTWSLKKAWARAPDVRVLPPAQPSGDEKVCAIVVTYQPGSMLLENLRALARQVEHIVIVDNDSDEACLAPVLELADQSNGRMEVVRNGQNIGLARAQNQGIQMALNQGYPWVLLLDDDSCPGEGMVQALLAAYREMPRRKPIGLLAPKIERVGIERDQPYAVANNRLHFSRRSFCGLPVMKDLLFAIASGSLIPAAAIRHVGSMRDEFFIDYVDIEFCLRLREAGYTIVGVKAARLSHSVGATEERRLVGQPLPITHHPSWRRYHIFRNRVYLWRTRGYRWPAWFVFDMAAALLDLVRILRFEDESRAKLRGALRGMWDGVRKRLPEITPGSR